MRITKTAPTMIAERKTSKHVAYRERQGEAYRAKNRKRMRATRAAAIPQFIGVDSEGIGRGKDHRAVLLGVGQNQYLAKDTRKGLHWREVFEFLYRQFECAPQAAYVGFYLTYDFNEWLKSLPRDKAWLLLTAKGRATRKMNKAHSRRAYFPVRLPGWEIDMLGFKRLSIRPRQCTCIEDGIKCPHPQSPWMNICDAGTFFQSTFLKVLESMRDRGTITDEEFNKVEYGKNNLRADQAAITAKHKEYNALENVLLARAMTQLATGFTKIGIKLAKDEWYGPGASAAKWLRQQGIVKNKDLSEIMPDWFIEICQKSYFGGWFEIFSHGLIRGSSWNYDINSAYPYASSKLPHICDECRYRRGKGEPENHGDYVLVYASVFTKGNRIGALPHRDKKGSILRPSITKGWYWLSEIRAAERAGLVDKIFYTEWAEFIPCSHEGPFKEIQKLYDLRISKEVGKNSAIGLAIKLVINSIYGKFAQSTGSAPYNNWFYASAITSHCRAQILDAIGTIPGGSDSVLMVATDGVAFDKPHPGLPISKSLGDWDVTEYTDLCLFKPGVYWHKEGKEALLQVKSRGVPKQEFSEGVDVMEALFREMLRTGEVPGSILLNEVIRRQIPDDMPLDYLMGIRGWPRFTVPVNFRQKSCRAALNEGKWEKAGEVQEKVWLSQDSDPQNKRRRPYYNAGKRRIDTIIHSLPFGATETKYYGSIRYPTGDLGYGLEGSAIDPLLEGAAALRDKQANYDLPFNKGLEDEGYEWVNIIGGD
jgi:DNA polymerase type B, organellar and viral